MFVGPSAVCFSTRRPALLRKCFRVLLVQPSRETCEQFWSQFLGLPPVSVSVDALRGFQDTRLLNTCLRTSDPCVVLLLSVQIRYMIRPESEQMVQ